MSFSPTAANDASAWPASWPGPDAGAASPTSADQIAFRQLRHQTKNALQSLLCAVYDSADRAGTPAMRALAEELQERICLSAAISDALFGFTERPAPLNQRLPALASAMLRQLGGAPHCIELMVTVDSPAPPDQDDTILRVAHEMIGNAIKHGLHARLVGHIEIHLSSSRSRTRLTVADDGWGLAHRQDGDGQGLLLMRDLARGHAGQVSLERVQDWTVATLDLPTTARHNLMRLT